ncbi:MAG: OmpH family outer membrane protein [Candidatus Omnitrophica bacterium]|nr:OmpH family outer membrane protein [Candidatus Omnitrophota bacterium]
MKKILIAFWAVLFFYFLFLNPVFSLDKIACVDLLRIAKEYTKAQAYNKALDDKQTAYRAEIDKKANEIRQFQDKLNLLSEKEKEAKRQELENKIKALDDFIKEKELDLRKTELENTKEILKEIEDVVKQYAEKEGYTLVLDDRSLLYRVDTLDITDKIIEILNKDYASKKDKR